MFQCHLCVLDFEREVGLKIHLRSKHNEYTLLDDPVTSEYTLDCDRCGKKYEKVCQLRLHKKLTHDKVEDAYSCELCDFKTNLKSNLKYHVELKHLNKTFTCTVCDFSGKTTFSLKAHIKGKL